MHPERLGREKSHTMRQEGKHDLSVDINHDELSRLDFQMSCGFHVSQKIFPANYKSWSLKYKKKFHKNYKRNPVNRIEIRPYMKKNFIWQLWSSLKRSNQEINYSIRGEIIDRQESKSQEKYNNLINKTNKKFLKINRNFSIPKYVDKVDIHCMPGGYNADNGDGFFAGKNYDTASLYLATGGELGKWSDGAGWANILFLKNNFPKFAPNSVLDIGCSVGHSTVPLKEYWPKANIFGIDSCAPLLRYAHARSTSFKKNIFYSQQNAEFTNFPNKSFDLITSTMFLHEVPQKNIYSIGKEIYRLLKPGGIMLHNEQPQYHNQPPIDQFLREWDTWYNNEPMRCAFRDMDLNNWVKRSGFNSKKLITILSPNAQKIKNTVKSTKNGSWFIIANQK